MQDTSYVRAKGPDLYRRGLYTFWKRTIAPPMMVNFDAANREALWAGIADGRIDAVATDHVHRDLSGKAGGIWAASPGCPGLETLLPVMLSEGHTKRGIPLRRIVQLLAANPARAMGLWPVKGRISGVFGSQRILNGEAKTPHSGLDVAAPEVIAAVDPASGAPLSDHEAIAVTIRCR